MKYFSVYPSVGGFFKNSRAVGVKGHPVRFRFRARRPLRELADHIVVHVELADTGGSIERFVDMDSTASNGTATPSGMFTLYGNKIKIRDGGDDCGLWFVSAAAPYARFKAAVFAVNTSRRLIGRIPPLPSGVFSLEIKTCYTVGGIDLKEPRTVASGFTVSVGG